MALNASGPISLAGSTTGQSIAVELGLGATTEISLNQAAVRTLAGIASGAIIMPTNFWGKSNFTNTQKAMLLNGAVNTTAYTSTVNLITSSGTVGANTATSGSIRANGFGVTYGTDKGICGFGKTSFSVYNSTTSLVSNVGVVAASTASSGTTARQVPQCAGYGTGGAAALYGGQSASALTTTRNLISNTGVVAANSSTGAASSIGYGCTRYGTTGLSVLVGGIFSFSSVPPYINTASYIDVNATVAAAITVSGTGRGASYANTACMIGSGQAIQLQCSVWDNGSTAQPAGTLPRVINMISSAGVVASDTTIAAGPTMRVGYYSGTNYGNDKAIMCCGRSDASATNLVTNLISNTGVVAADVAFVSAAAGRRENFSAFGYSMVA